jgi:hypothetical protein
LLRDSGGPDVRKRENLPCQRQELTRQIHDDLRLRAFLAACDFRRASSTGYFTA